VARYTVNQAAVAKCRELINAKQYVLDSDWGEVQPNAEVQNAFLDKHSWEEYAAWHLGLTEGAKEWRHKQVELVAHDLLQLLDSAAGIS
jgi:hypothetical protein